MARTLFNTLILFCSVLLTVCNADDPCYTLQDPVYGSIGNCIPNSSCLNNVTVPDMCPSYPSDHVCCFSDAFPGREGRGAWIATVANIDWPNSPSDSVATQKSTLEFLIDQLEDAGINTIYFQVRPAGDALYQSDIEPWSVYLTGSQGQAPNPLWDPLQHVIEYSHSKGIQVHAWINPYRASLSPTSNGLAPNHMAKQFPEYAYTFSTYLWMDPGAEVVQNRTYEVAIDLVTRYDLDGIHMDDYFYPYPVTGVTFPDDDTYADYIDNQGGVLPKDDWRRDNVNKLIERLYIGMHRIKPFIVFSVSPFGIYRPCHDEGMPCSIQGFDQYSEIYCDPKIWLQEGWIDVLQPQLYWKIDPPVQSYPVLLDWWVSQNPHARHIYAGNYLSRVLDGWPLSELTDQITISRKSEHRTRGSWGNVQFSAQIFKNNYQGAIQHFKETVYQFPALPPFFPWLNPMPKGSKSLPQFQTTNNGLMLNTFTEALVHKIVIYEKNWNSASWHVKKIVQVLSGEKSMHWEIKLERPGVYAASTLDRFGQESSKFYYEMK